MIRISPVAAAVAVSGALGLAALGLGAGIAQADTWRPGDNLFTGISNWDMNICHEHYWPPNYDLNAPTTLFIEGALPGTPATGFRGRGLFTDLPLPC